MLTSWPNLFSRRSPRIFLATNLPTKAAMVARGCDDGSCRLAAPGGSAKSGAADGQVLTCCCGRRMRGKYQSSRRSHESVGNCRGVKEYCEESLFCSKEGEGASRFVQGRCWTCSSKVRVAGMLYHKQASMYVCMYVLAGLLCSWQALECYYVTHATQAQGGWREPCARGRPSPSPMTKATGPWRGRPQFQGFSEGGTILAARPPALALAQSNPAHAPAAPPQRAKATDQSQQRCHVEGLVGDQYRSPAGAGL